MSIEYKILGKPGRDNALFVWLNCGTKMYRILFDCGENIFYGLKQSDVRSIDYLFFSHLHVDHAAGFDYYFRRNFDRQKPNFIFGPADTIEILHNRLRGFKWNLIDESDGEFIITEIESNKNNSARFLTSESFAIKHLSSAEITNNGILQNDDFTIKAALLNHQIKSAAYLLKENDSLNISKEALLQSGLTPGNWLESVRNMETDDEAEIKVDDANYKIGELRKSLLIKSKGESISYLTDFIMDDKSKNSAVELVKDCDIMICESQYHSTDIELAKRNFHLTSKQAAELAREAGVKKLYLFHISERYTSNGTYYRLLDEARNIFPETYFPEHWVER